MKKLLTCFLAVILSGCVGIATISSKDSNYSAPRFALDSTKVGSVFENSDTSLPWRNTKKSVLSQWGEPVSKTVLGNGQESWTYRQSDLSWRGVVVWIVIPIIPLVLPVGHDSVTLTFDGETLVSASASGKQMSFCGYMISDETAGASCK